MSRVLVLLTCLGALPTAAKPWQGLLPGSAASADALLKLGEPSRRTPGKDGGEIWVYDKNTAVEGTSQAQLHLDAKRIIRRIDVFPTVKLIASEIEDAYGPECRPKSLEPSCYVRQGGSQAKRLAFNYGALGLIVFFNDDGEVRSMTFLPEKSGPP